MKGKSLFISSVIFFMAICVPGPSITNAEVHVYDNNNKYLGILLDLGGENFSVFVPSVKGSFGVDYEESVDCPDTAYFENGTCTGIPYEKDHLPVILDFSNSSLAGFYMPDYNQTATFTPGSVLDFNCDCQPWSGSPAPVYYRLVEVQVPFTTPIALPLRFEVRNSAVVIPLN